MLLKAIPRALLLSAGFLAFAQPISPVKDMQAFDPRVNGVELRRPDHTTLTRERPGKYLKRNGSYFVQYYNASGRQLLTLVAVGSKTTNFRSYEISEIDKPFAVDTVVLKDVALFSTGKGIHLGMTRSEISRLLGPPLREGKNDSGALFFAYAAKMPSGPSLGQEKAYRYSSIYTFGHGKLTDILVSLN